MWKNELPKKAGYYWFMSKSWLEHCEETKIEAIPWIMTVKPVFEIDGQSKDDTLAIDYTEKGGGTPSYAMLESYAEVGYWNPVRKEKFKKPNG